MICPFWTPDTHFLLSTFKKDSEDVVSLLIRLLWVCVIKVLLWIYGWPLTIECNITRTSEIIIPLARIDVDINKVSSRQSALPSLRKRDIAASLDALIYCVYVHRLTSPDISLFFDAYSLAF